MNVNILRDTEQEPSAIAARRFDKKYNLRLLRHPIPIGAARSFHPKLRQCSLFLMAAPRKKGHLFLRKRRENGEFPRLTPSVGNSQRFASSQVGLELRCSAVHDH